MTQTRTWRGAGTGISIRTGTSMRTGHQHGQGHRQEQEHGDGYGNRYGTGNTNGYRNGWVNQLIPLSAKYIFLDSPFKFCSSAASLILRILATSCLMSLAYTNTLWQKLKGT